MINATQKYQKMEKLCNTIIFHPQYNVAFEQIINSFEMNKTAGLSQHLLCLGQSGLGKSTLKKMIQNKYPPIETEDRKILPVLTVDTPSSPTIKNMAEAVLIQLDDPLFARGSAIDKTNRVLTLLKEKKVKLIIVDELQHFIDQGNRKAPLEVSDWLKTIIDQSSTSTVLMGLKRSERILQINEQLRRRFSKRIELIPFSIGDEYQASIFLGVIEHFDELLGLPNKMVVDNKLLRRFHYATNGVIDYILQLFLGSLEQLSTTSKNAVDQIYRHDFTRQLFWKALSFRFVFNCGCLFVINLS
jgi:energy-coupling factor transporter ATP-binding protein EcfA2